MEDDRKSLGSNLSFLCDYLFRTNPSRQHYRDVNPIHYSLRTTLKLSIEGAGKYHSCSAREQRASNWLERLPTGSITTWEDLTTRFLSQFFPPRRKAKLHNDILMFQQHHRESLSEAWTRPSPQPQALETTFEARVRDYMATHTERMERFENAIFKQCEGINSRMTEMFGHLYQGLKTRGTLRKYDKEKKPNSRHPKAVDAPGSQPVAYYLKHKINEKLIEGLVDNNIFNNSQSGTRVGNKKGNTYKVLPRGPIYDAILKKKITKKEDIGGNFKMPNSIGGLKHANALVDQGSDVNVMPYSTYMKITNERPAETDIRLSLASHSYIYPLGIAEDVLVEVAEYVYPVDFVILDIKENEKRPFILGTPFLTTAKAIIRFDKGTITLSSKKVRNDPIYMATKEEMDDEGEVT
ncbi:zinc finger, CCHC-type containing protein [Tanacetum coccineum]